MGSCTFHPVVATFHPAAAAITPGYQKLSTRLHRHLHPVAATSTRMPPFSTFHFPSGNLPPHSTMVGIPPGCRHITPENLLPHYTRLPPLSTRMYHIRNFGRVTFHLLRMFHIRQTYPDGRRGRFKLPRSDISGSTDSAYPESFAANFAQCCGVLLKLPDICDRHL